MNCPFLLNTLPHSFPNLKVELLIDRETPPYAQYLCYIKQQLTDWCAATQNITYLRVEN